MTYRWCTLRGGPFDGQEHIIDTEQDHIWIATPSPIIELGKFAGPDHVYRHLYERKEFIYPNKHEPEYSYHYKETPPPNGLIAPPVKRRGFFMPENIMLDGHGLRH